MRSSSALYHTCNCTTLANCTTLGARGDENRTRARFTRTRSPAESILIHEATTSVGEAMTCQRSRRGGSLPPPADRWRGGVGRGRRRRTRASGMLIPSWRAHLHPLVDDDAQASAGDEAHLGFWTSGRGSAGAVTSGTFFAEFPLSFMCLLAVIAPYSFSSLKIIHTAVSVH